MKLNPQASINKLTSNYTLAEYEALPDKTGLYVVQG